MLSGQLAYFSKDGKYIYLVQRIDIGGLFAAALPSAPTFLNKLPA